MKKIFLVTFWTILGIGIILILIFANLANGKDISKTPTILIHVQGENAFLTENELLDRLVFKRLFTPGVPVNKINKRIFFIIGLFN